MKLQFFTGDDSQEVVIPSNKPEPTLRISKEEVERLTGMAGGPTVLRVIIENPNGTVSVGSFSVSVDGGRPRGRVSMRRSEKTPKTVEATGGWITPIEG